MVDNSSADVAAYYQRAVDTAFHAAEQRRKRPVHRMSASYVGECLRQQAYRMALTPPDDTHTDDNVHRSATLGTALHDWLVPELSQTLDGSDTEQEVVARLAGVEITGRYDLYDPQAPHGPTVLDVKTVGQWSYRRILAGSHPRRHVLQSSLYALGHVQAGRPVHWLVWAYVNRDTGEDVLTAMPFTTALAVGAIDRVRDIVLASAAPQSARREAPGPSAHLRSRSWSPCDRCPWLRRCWGNPVQGVAPQAAVVTDDGDDAAAYVHDYYNAQQVAKQAEQDKDFARSVLTGVSDGVYAGLELKRTKKGAISVRPAKKEEKEGVADADVS